MANASMDLWLEGDWGKENIVWHGEIAFDMDLFVSDPTYADILDAHVKRSMEFLKREIEELGLRYRLGKPV